MKANADLNLQNLIIDDLDFDGASGICRFSDCRIRTLDLDTASGDVTFSGTLDALDFDAASASFTAIVTNTPVALEMDSMSGRLDITLPEDCGYTVNMDALSSNFHSDFGNALLSGDGRCRIETDGMNCDVIIRRPTIS